MARILTLFRIYVASSVVPIGVLAAAAAQNISHVTVDLSLVNGIFGRDLLCIVIISAVADQPI